MTSKAHLTIVVAVVLGLVLLTIPAQSAWAAAPQAPVLQEGQEGYVPQKAPTPTPEDPGEEIAERLPETGETAHPASAWYWLLAIAALGLVAAVARQVAHHRS